VYMDLQDGSGSSEQRPASSQSDGLLSMASGRYVLRPSLLNPTYALSHQMMESFLIRCSRTVGCDIIGLVKFERCGTLRAHLPSNSSNMRETSQGVY